MGLVPKSRRRSLKPGIDWVEIRRRYQNGETPTAIAKTAGVTRQAITKHIKAHHWQQLPKVTEEKPFSMTILPSMSDSTQIVGNAENLTGTSELAEVYNAVPEIGTKGTRERIEKILSYLTDGCSAAVAARAAGIHPVTLAGWRERVAELDQAVETAQAQWALKAIRGLNSAGDRGDWKAFHTLLETHPLTKDTFLKQGGGAGGIQVIINVPAPRPLEDQDVLIIPHKK